MISVGSIGFHGCVRQIKQGYCLVNSGVTVHLACAFYPTSHYYDGFETTSVYSVDTLTPGEVDTRQLTQIVKLLDSHVDLFHVHNEPNWIFQYVRENTKKPVVWDIHDWTSLRKGGSTEFELEAEAYALDHADAFVVPSEGYLRRIRAISSKPSMLVYSKVPRFLYPENPSPRQPGLTYEGGLKGVDANTSYNFDYRDWAEFLKAVELPEGHKVHLYSANDGDNFKNYEHPNFELHKVLRYRPLLDALSQHSVGVVGCPYPLPDFEDSMPNKLFEYIAAGIPVIVLNAPEAQRYVERYGLGQGVRDASQVKEALAKLTSHEVVRERWRHTLDGEIAALIQFYGELVGCNTRNIAQVGP